jgi:hypothetical protein
VKIDKTKFLKGVKRMDFEIRPWNTDRAAEVINKLLPGRSISLDESILDGVEKVIIEKGEMMDSEPCPGEGYDGGLRDLITLRFKMIGGGKVTRFFEPINEACTVHLEADDLLIITFTSLHEHVKRVKESLDERLKENEDFCLPTTTGRTCTGNNAMMCQPVAGAGGIGGWVCF